MRKRNMEIWKKVRGRKKEFKTKKLDYLSWINSIQNSINELIRYDYDFIIKENIISFNYYKNKKVFSVEKNKIKQLLSYGLQNCFQVPSFMIEQYGSFLPELEIHNKTVVEQTNTFSD